MWSKEKKDWWDFSLLSKPPQVKWIFIQKDFFLKKNEECLLKIHVTVTLKSLSIVVHIITFCQKFKPYKTIELTLYLTC